MSNISVCASITLLERKIWGGAYIAVYCVGQPAAGKDLFQICRAVSCSRNPETNRCFNNCLVTTM